MHISEATQLGVKFMVFGGFGTGKSRFASTLPQPIYFFDCDKGIRTVYERLLAEGRDLSKEDIEFDQYWDGPYLYKRTQTIQTSLMNAIHPSPNAYLSYEDKLGDFIELAEKGELKYRTVVVDSLTTLTLIFMNYIKYLSQEQGRMMGNANLNDMGNYVRKMPEVLSMIHMLSDHGVNTVVNCHTQLKEDIRGLKANPKEKDSVDQLEYKGTWRLPAIIGKDLPFQIGSFFDEVYYSFAERAGQVVNYKFETKGDKDLLCKSRSPEMPIEIAQDWGEVRRHLHLDERGRSMAA